MSMESVRNAIVEVRRRIREGDALAPELDVWREEYTRYALVDPVLVALGWNIHDARQCQQLWQYPDGQGEVDYALQRPTEAEHLATPGGRPHIIIEAKALRTPLDGEPLAQLERCAKTHPRMERGHSVHTDGNHWRIYETPGRRSFANMIPFAVSVERTSLDWSSKVLHLLLTNPRP